jgi:hypothetical protein
MKTIPPIPISTSHSSDTLTSLTKFAITTFTYTFTTIPTVPTTPVSISCTLSGVGDVNSAAYHNNISWTTASSTQFAGAWAAGTWA